MCDTISVKYLSTHTHTHTYIYIYIYESRSKSSEPNLDRRALADHFGYRNTLLLLIKLEKLVDFCLNFCADEANKNVRGVR